MELGKLMFDLRKQAGLTLDEAAIEGRKHIPYGYSKGLSATAVHRIEKSGREPDLILVRALLKGYEVPVDTYPDELRERFEAIAALVGSTSSWGDVLADLQEAHAA